MTPFLAEDIKSDEGFRRHAYPDPLSGGEPWTCGYGCTGAGIGPKTVWSVTKAEAALAQKLADTIRQLTREIPWWATLNDPRQDVLVNMAFNMGVEGLMGFTRTLAAIKAGDWADAASDMLASTWASQVPNRAKRLAEQMLTGVRVAPS